MNFMKAVKAMKEGKSVRRPHWNKDVSRIKESNMCPDFEEYEARDWEIYVEEDTWNLVDKILKGDRTIIKEENHKYVDAIMVSDLKIFIQKVKEDVEELIKTPAGFGPINEIIDKRAGDL